MKKITVCGRVIKIKDLNYERNSMIHIIETNIGLNNDIIQDHQSRVIEVESWDTYIDMIKNYNGEPVGDYKSVYGNMIGYSIPKCAEVTNLKYDDFHLSCDVATWNGWKHKKLAYLLG